MTTKFPDYEGNSQETKIKIMVSEAGTLSGCGQIRPI